MHTSSELTIISFGMPLNVFRKFLNAITSSRLHSSPSFSTCVDFRCLLDERRPVHGMVDW